MAPSNEKPTSIIGENGIQTGTGSNDDVSPEELAKMMPNGIMTFLSHIIPAFYAAPVGYYVSISHKSHYNPNYQLILALLHRSPLASALTGITLSLSLESRLPFSPSSSFQLGPDAHVFAELPTADLQPLPAYAFLRAFLSLLHL